MPCGWWSSRRFGEMICSHPPEMTSVPIIEAVNKIRRVDPNGPAVQGGQALGISFGDRPANEASSGVFTSDEVRQCVTLNPGEQLLDATEEVLEAALAE